MFGDGVLLRIGKGKGSETVGVGDGGLRSDIGEFGVGGSRVGETLSTAIMRTRGRRENNYFNCHVIEQCSNID